jgi:hypothetical protein
MLVVHLIGLSGGRMLSWTEFGMSLFWASGEVFAGDAGHDYADSLKNHIIEL